MKDSVIPNKTRLKIWKKANKIHKDNRAFFEWYFNNADAMVQMESESIEQWWLVVLLTNVAFDEGKEQEFNHPRVDNYDYDAFIDKTLNRLELKFNVNKEQVQQEIVK